MLSSHDFDLPVKISVGYMLWVMKNRWKIPKHLNRPFKMVRHGDFHGFITEIGGETGEQSVWINGNVSKHTMSYPTDVLFLGIIKSEQSLHRWYQDCKKHFGSFHDLDISSSTYMNLVVFELGLRIHAENNGMGKTGEMPAVISKITKLLNLQSQEQTALLKGNEFLNAVKHPQNMKAHFKSWQEGLTCFLQAFEVLDRYRLTIK